MGKFPVAFVIDDNYAMQAAVTITSIVANKDPNVDYKFYVCSNGLSQENKDLLYSFENDYPGTLVEIIEINLENFASIYANSDSVVLDYISSTVLGKILLPEIIPEDEVLYLDADILVRKDISELFSLPLDEYVAAVARDTGGMYYRTHILATTPHYFNAGVMLMNLKKSRELDMTSKVIEELGNLKDFNLLDQDAFNVAYDGMTLLLPPKYNALLVNLNYAAGNYSMDQLNELAGTSYSCLYDLDEDAKIVHFSSRLKPWLYDDLRYEGMRFSDEWFECYKASPYGVADLQREKLHPEDDLTAVDVPVAIGVGEGGMFNACVSAVSLMENADPHCVYSIYFLVSDHVDEERTAQLEALFGGYKNCRIEMCGVEKCFEGGDARDALAQDPSFWKLVLPSCFPQHDKLIYLDSNVVVTGDIAGLYGVDLGDAFVGGVKETCVRYLENIHGPYGRLVDLADDERNVDAAVLLLNLKAMRECGVGHEIVGAAACGKSSADALNDVCRGRVRYLEYKYNCLLPVYRGGQSGPAGFSVEAVNEANNRPVVIQFGGEKKPWESFSCPLADRWWKYARMIPGWESALRVDAAEVDSLVGQGKAAVFSRRWTPKSIFAGMHVEDYMTARVLLKNCGEDSSDLVMLGASDPDVQISEPTWFNTDSCGKGYEVLSRRGRLNLRFRCVGDGILTVILRGVDVLDECKNHIPIWIEYTSAQIDGEPLFTQPIIAGGYHPYKFTKDVRDGAVADLCISWKIANSDMKAEESAGLRSRAEAAEEESAGLRSQVKLLSNAAEEEKARTARLSRNLTACIDLKNAGAEGNCLEIMEISDPEAIVETPVWFRGASGAGYVVRSDAGSLRLSLLCLGKGRLQIGLKGQEVRGAGGTCIPVWIDYTSLLVDGRPVLEEPRAAWYDHPAKFVLPVEDNQVVSLSLSWHSHDVKGLEDMEKVARERKALAEENAKLESRLKDQEAEIKRQKTLTAQQVTETERQKAEVERLRASNSWKAGRVLTWLPRKIKKLAKRSSRS